MKFSSAHTVLVAVVLVISTWWSFGKELLVYDLLPDGVLASDTRLQVMALHQLLAKLSNQGKLQRHLLDSLIYPTRPAREVACKQPQHERFMDPTMCPEELLKQASLDSFTLCLWVNISYVKGLSSLLSYSVSETYDNALFIGTTFRKIVVSYMNNKVLQEGLQVVEPQRWHLVCLRRDGGTQRLGFFLDGQELLSEDTPGYLPLNGTLALGNGWNSFTDSYSVSQPFPGSVTGLNLWSRALTQMEMYSVGSCDVPNNILLAWHNIPWKITGKVQERHIDPCQEITNLKHFFLPIKMSYANADWFCSAHGLNFPFPTSEQENKKITSLMTTATGTEFCLSSYSPYVTTWLGISYDSNIQHWVGGPDRRPITYSKLHPMSYPENKVVILQQDGIWIPTFKNIAQCTVCEGKMWKLQVTIRGLCAEEGVEADYMAMYPRADPKGMYYLQGATGLRLHHISSYHWVIQHLPSNITVATYEGTEFFWGRKEWSLKSTEVCGRRQSLHGPHNLTISWCGPGNYTCWSGKCVPLTHRCSFDSECHDNTDEKDCNLIHIPQDYQYHLPPYSPYLTLDFTISLNKVSSVDLMGQLVEANFKVKLRWHDHRLTFHNLQEDPRLNMLQSQYSYPKVRMRLPKGRVWYPSIKVVDEERLAGVVMPLSQLVIRRTTSGEDHVTDYVYKGSENDLEYSLEYESNLHCELNLMIYPFDTQQCFITIVLTNVLDDFILYSHAVSGLQQTLTHPEFTIKHLTLSLQNHSNMGQLSFQLQRRPSHHLFSTYLPTTLLHLIGYGTLFLRPQNFQDRGVLSLTTLLVLISFYSDSIAELPNTSYLKSIDIWFISSIAFLTTIITVHLTTSDTRTHVTPVNNHLVPQMAWRRALKVLFHQRHEARILRVAKVVLGIVYIIFHYIYWLRIVHLN